MKKLYTFLFIAFIGFVGNAQIINIPDANFKAKLLAASPTNYVAINSANAYFKIDSNNDGEIQVSEALLVRSLIVTTSNIASLVGISSFTNLRSLACSQNQLTTLNLTGLTNLTGVSCGNNQFTTLDFSANTNLQSIDCQYNQLTTLNLTGLIHLTSLNCLGNQLSSLNLSGITTLTTLYCDHNNLTSLNVIAMTNLAELHFSYNQISTINVTGLTHLTTFNGDNNLLTTVNFSGLTALQVIYCDSNLLTSVTLTGLTNLEVLYLAGNQLSSINLNVGLSHIGTLALGNNQFTSLNLTGIPTLQSLVFTSNMISSINLTAVPSLIGLSCGNNQLSTLDLSSVPLLQTLYCDNNLFTSLQLSSLSHLNYLKCQNNPNLSSLYFKIGSALSYLYDLDFSGNTNLTFICTDENKVAYCKGYVNQYGYTNCEVNSYCTFTPGGTYYTIQGNNRYDANGNGCDVNDYNFPNLKINISNGTIAGSTIGNMTGSYTIPVEAGTYTLTPVIENPTYYTISPSVASVIFPATASPFTQNFCLSANGLHNDLEVVLLPLNNARPGFDSNYKIIYKNKGNSVQSGSVNFTYDNSIIHLVSTSQSISSQITNGLLWSFSNLLPFETREIALTLHVNSTLDTPAVALGDLINSTAAITNTNDETPADNSSSLTQIAVSSFDPNDKTCLEGAVLPTTLAGGYVHYIIHFENTGTAAAQNIVVKDMIDGTKFDVSSLIPLSGSAPYTTRITNTNQVEFVFQNINLPFASGTNTGYVSFKIKTKPTLVEEDTFSNTANIYFDYNAPIVTNTFTTTFQTLGTTAFDFGNSFTLSPNPSKNSLTISAKEEVTISSMSIYNTLGQLVQIITTPKETVDVSTLKTGTYFIRILSDKGSTTRKFIKE